MSKVLVAGSTGLVGSHIINLLAGVPSVSRIRALMRKPPLSPLPNPDKTVACIADASTIHVNSEWLAVDAVFCAIGTTMKIAGTREVFRQVDFDYPLQIAKLALQRNCKHFLLVSALGANAGSLIFYNKVKGELEQAIINLDFESTTIVRPSLLIGNRNDLRTGEKFMTPIMNIAPKRFRAVEAKQVAQALVTSYLNGGKGLQIIENKELFS